MFPLPGAGLLSVSKNNNLHKNIRNPQLCKDELSLNLPIRKEKKISYTATTPSVSVQLAGLPWHVVHYRKNHTITELFFNANNLRTDS